MELQYLYHSGFAVKAEEFTMVIDYYLDTCEKGSLRSAENGVVDEDLLSRPGRFYVMASHSHHDHYNPVILKWKERRKDIIYIFSDDISVAGKNNDIHYLKKGESYQDDILRVTAYGSTDIGVSFAVKTNKGVNIFHAGDLNNWHWKEESPIEEAQKCEENFLHEVSIIRKDNPYFDVVMFPIDPRLGEDYMRGAVQFLQDVKAGLFVPMHFWNKYEKAAAFEKEAVANGCRFARWQRRGQIYEIEVSGYGN